MRLLCVANWSEGRDVSLLDAMRFELRAHDAEVHFDGADEDHNRIVTAFSGEASKVRATLLSLAETAFASINMQSHDGVHPRVGALDVCPFILLDGELGEALLFTESLGAEIAEKYALPIFLYEKSETGKHAADLPSLRRGQFEGLLGRALDPDFGPNSANPRLGVTVLGVRDWLIAMNVNLPEGCLMEARAIAREMRVQRDSGETRFAGVRALGLPLHRRRMAQVSMNLTRPDEVAADEVIEWIAEREQVVGTELIGVIRRKDLAKASRLDVLDEQILD